MCTPDPPPKQHSKVLGAPCSFFPTPGKCEKLSYNFISSRSLSCEHLTESGSREKFCCVAIFVQGGNFSAEIIVFCLRTALTVSHTGTTEAFPRANGHRHTNKMSFRTCTRKQGHGYPVTCDMDVYPVTWIPCDM